MASPAGCEHYVRSCLLKAPCCGKLYVCRLCHDAEENHHMDRFKVREVQCSQCQTVQQAQQTCQQCHVQFGEYYCDICHLFDKDKKQYHCQPCGICRIGPREKYFHCEKCNLCLAQNLQGNHKCVENVSRQNCPVCMEDIHTSRIGAHVLPCGHLLHKTCFDDMVRTGYVYFFFMHCWNNPASGRGLEKPGFPQVDFSWRTPVSPRAIVSLLQNKHVLKKAYRCPLCMHSAWDMEEQWDLIDIEISQSPMPAEYQSVTVKIVCNDCQAHCTVPFHVLGMKCSSCGSYNTAQEGGLIQQPEQQPEQNTETETDTEPELQDQPESPRPH